jgi:hypothetical protein
MGLLEKQFSRPTEGDLTADGYSDFFNFSTGRRNIASLHTVFTLRPRHDLFQLIYQTGWGLIDLLYTPKDDVSLDFKLHATVAVPDFVWALVVKEEANSIKNERWDLVSHAIPLPAPPMVTLTALAINRHSQKPPRTHRFLPTWLL